MKTNRVKAVLSVLVLAVQCMVLGWLIWRYENIVRFGTEVRLRCEAYDPYDPLRGRYLHTTVRETCPGIATDKVVAYAKLEPSTNGLWRIAAVAETPKSDDGLWIKPKGVRIEHALKWSDKGKDEMWKDFEKRRNASPFVATVTMPDQLFLNERLAPAAEKILRDATSAKGKGAVAVYRVKNGDIVITDIEIEGKSVTSLARDALRHSVSNN